MGANFTISGAIESPPQLTPQLRNGPCSLEIVRIFRRSHASVRKFGYPTNHFMLQRLIS